MVQVVSAIKIIITGNIINDRCRVLSSSKNHLYINGRYNKMYSYVLFAQLAACESLRHFDNN